MPKLLTTIETNEGRVHVITRSRWLYVFPMPYTSVAPHRAADLACLGTFIRWQSSAPLATCHEAVIHLVKEIGISGVASMAANEKNNERVAKAAGLTYRELLEEAMKSREALPDLDGVLRYVKRFI